MATDEYTRARKWAQSGQARQMAKPARPSRAREHLMRHHGVSEDTLANTSDVMALHERAHGSVFGVGGTNDYRHHHEDVDVGREHTVAMARMNQTFNDRRGPNLGDEPTGPYYGDQVNGRRVSGR